MNTDRLEQIVKDILRKEIEFNLLNLDVEYVGDEFDENKYVKLSDVLDIVNNTP